MTYRELLKLCTEKPGCIQTSEQKKADSDMRYRIWLDTENEEYGQEIHNKRSGK